VYMISAALAELSKAKFAAMEVQDPYPAVLEILAYAIRIGLDTPEKVAFAHHRPAIKTRVGMHRASVRQVGILPPLPNASFRDVLRHVQAVLAFRDADDGEPH
jgi:hypothetical protein